MTVSNRWHEPRNEGSAANGEREPEAREPRWVMFDAARFCAAAAIVWLHTPESHALKRWADLGRFSVPFFTASAVFLGARTARRSGANLSFVRYAGSRAKRLYLPFLAWTLLYVVTRNIKYAVLSGAPLHILEPGLLWNGSAPHLWFLPFILCVTVGLFPLMQALMSKPGLRIPAMVISVLLGFAIAVTPTPDCLLVAPLVTHNAVAVWRAAPSMFFGVAAAAADFSPRFLALVRLPIATALGISATVLGTAFVLSVDHPAYFAENLAGIGWFVVALSHFDRRAVRALAALGELSFGIYLVHVLFVEGLQTIARRAGASEGASFDLEVFLAALVASAVMTRSLAHRRWTRWLLA